MTRGYLSDLCTLVSTKNPEFWPEEVLFPLKKEPVGIFGYAQVAMCRDKQVSILDALEWTGLCSSKTEAKNKLKGGAVRLNKTQIKENRTLTFGDAYVNLSALVLECGKYNYGIIEFV